MSNKLGRAVRFIGTSLLFVLAVGWFFSIERRADHNRSSNLNSDIVDLNKDQLAVVEFVKQNPELADELSDLTKLVGVVRQNYVEDKPSDDLLRLAMKGIPEALDPNNRLYTGSNIDEIKKALGEQKYLGIGIQIVEVGKLIIITNVFPDSPSEKAGLQPGDHILKVNGQNVWGMDVSKVVNMIKGEEGTPVSLEIGRATLQQPFKTVLNRQNVVVVSVEDTLFDKNVGYIKINSCGEETARRFFAAIDKLRNSRGLVIDLRNNPGGLVSCAQSVLGYFIDIGQPIITVKSRNDEEVVLSSVTKGLYPKNVVVLINNYSASASEIIAGDLRYYKVATLVGVRTYGKQTVQRFFDVKSGLPIGDLSSVGSDLIISLTVAHYFLPDGTNVSEDGVVPDVEIEQPGDFKLFEYKTARDLQFQKAIEILTAK